MLSFLILAAVSLTGHARPFFDIADRDYLAQARPLIDRFVAEQEQRYGVRFALDERTWAIKTFTSLSTATLVPPFNGGRWDVMCRELSAELGDGSHARAHFFVRVTFPQNKPVHHPRGENPSYALVRSCANVGAGQSGPPAMEIDGRPAERNFSDEEFIRLGTPLLRTFLRAKGKSDQFDDDSFRLRRKGVDIDDNRGAFGWAYSKFFPRNVACRRLRVVIPKEKAVFTAFVSVLYDRDDLTPHLPAEAQTIYMDPRTYRPYRFSMVKGCDRDGFFEPAVLRLRPVKLAPPPPPPLPIEPTPAERPPEVTITP